MQGMTITSPANPFVKRTDTRNTHRAEGEWVRDNECPRFPVKGGYWCHGVRVDSEGRAWGSYRVVKGDKA